MLSFIILVLILDLFSKIPCGYKDVPIYKPEKKEPDSDGIDKVIDYIEELYGSSADDTDEENTKKD